MGLAVAHRVQGSTAPDRVFVAAGGFRLEELWEALVVVRHALGIVSRRGKVIGVLAGLSMGLCVFNIMLVENRI